MADRDPVPAPGWPALLLLAAAALGLVGALHGLLGGRIAAEREAQELAIVREVMPLAHDNELLRDTLQVVDAERLGSADPVNVYRARLAGDAVGVVLLPVIAEGYNGRIELAIGIAADGTLAGVRVARQRETPGLGSRVHQHESDWLRQFDGRSLDNTAAAAWSVRADGGEFDQLSGATITPRGIINAVAKALEYHRLRRAELYR